MSTPLKSLTLGLAVASLLTFDAHALTLGQVAQVAANAQPAAFNSVEMVAYNAEERVPQWNRVKGALEGDMGTLQACLTDKSTCEGAAQQGWHDMVMGLLDQNQQTQLSLVNAFFNRWQYRTDMDTYGVSERWAGPLEFMQNSGDCEDYAIAKYVTLTFLGFEDDQMRVMAVIDNNRGGIGHSVLSVDTANGKMILDNLTDNVYSEAQQTGYAQRFAVNMDGIYTYAQQPRLKMASYTAE